MEKAETLLASYSNGTPSGAKLRSLVGEMMEATEQARSKNKNRSRPTITVAVPNALQRRLVFETIERNFSLFDDHGNEIIQVVRTTDLFSRNAPVVARRLIVVGARACLLYTSPSPRDRG